jgi:hypothetical protein
MEKLSDKFVNSEDICGCGKAKPGFRSREFSSEFGFFLVPL